MENKCKYCNKIFKHKTNLSHHQIHRCRKRPNYIKKKSKKEIIYDLKEEINYIREEYNICKTEIKILKEENKDLKKEIKKLKEIEKDKYRLEGEVKVYKKLKIKLKLNVKKKITYNNNSNNKTITINVIPAPFLKYENIDMIEKLLPGFLWKTITKRPALGVQDILEKTTFNPELPALNSVKMKNVNKPYLDISNGINYECKPKKEIISKLIMNASIIYEKYYNNIRHKLDDKERWKAEDYISKLPNCDKYTTDKITRKIECLMMDLRRYIDSEEWKMKIKEQLKKLEELHKVIEEEKRLLTM